MLTISESYRTHADIENGFSLQPIWRITFGGYKGLRIPRGPSTDSLSVEMFPSQAIPVAEKALENFNVLKQEGVATKREALDQLAPSYIWTSHFLHREKDPQAMNQHIHACTAPEVNAEIGEHVQEIHGCLRRNMCDVLGDKKMRKIDRALERSYSKESGSHYKYGLI